MTTIAQDYSRKSTRHGLITVSRWICRSRFPITAFDMDCAVENLSRKWRWRIRLSWRMLVTRGAPERGQSWTVHVTLTRWTNLEIVDLETLYCPATTVCEIPTAKSPKILFLFAKFSLCIFNKKRNPCWVNFLYSKSIRQCTQRVLFQFASC